MAIIVGTSLDDLIDLLNGPNGTATTGDDTIYGEDGSDTLIGGLGDDTLNGGAGGDWVSYEGYVNEGVLVDLQSGIALDGLNGVDSLISIEHARGSEAAGGDTLIGSVANNILHGLGGADRLFGLDGRDFLHGGDGDDTLDGGAGNDFMAGGAGNDFYRVSETADFVSEKLGEGLDTIESPISWTLSANVENLYLTGSVPLSGTGNNYANLISGNVGRSVLEGHGGHDTLLGNAGDDMLTGGAGNDRLDGGEGRDEANYGSAPAAVKVNLATGLASGGAGRDTLSSIEVVYGSAFNDTLTGGAGEHYAARGLAPAIEVLQGGAGNDLITGAPGVIVFASYQDSPGWVMANLLAGASLVHDEHGGTDTLVGIAGLVGSWYGDSLTAGNSSSEIYLEGWGGNDTLQALGRNVWAHYGLGYAGIWGELNEDPFLGSTIHDGFGGIDVLSGIHQIVASPFNDMLIGSHTQSVPERFRGMAGADYMDGRGGIDFADYAWSPNGIGADLASGIAQDGHGTTDTLVNVEGLTGSHHGDALTGDAGDNFFAPLGGNDTVVGAGGFDQLSYESAPARVSVNLQSGVASDGYGGTDALSGIEWIVGSPYGDALTGGPGDERFAGLAGADTLDGAGGVNTLDFSGEGGSAGVVASLTAGTASDTYGSPDSLANLRHVIGSAHADRIVGDANANRLQGGEGNDVLIGAAGPDTLAGGAGNDALAGGGGADVFLFDRVLGTDRIVDFVSGTDDLHFSLASFAALGTAGPLAAGDARFASGDGVTEGSLLAYDTATGYLYYDSDAGGPGGGALIATLANAPSLVATDISIV